MKYTKLYGSHNNYESSTLTSPIQLSYDNSHLHINYDYSKEYLTFFALENIEVSFTGTGLYYSLDYGHTWIEYIDPILVYKGDYIMFKGEMTPTGSTSALGSNLDQRGIGRFVCSGKFKASGNIMSLLFGDNFIGQLSLSGKNCAFSNLFRNNTNLISAKNIILPATTLSIACYFETFEACSSLIDTPKLPAKTLSSECYRDMFGNCISLMEISDDLTTTSTSLATYCFSGMFKRTGITIAPPLPHMTLANNCYAWMFYECPNLISCILPATTLVSTCYNKIFYNCPKLNYIKAMFTTTPSGSYTLEWVYGVPSSGTFVKNSSATWNVTGINGVPTGWTIETASS